jgi:hypothetical protein
VANANGAQVEEILEKLTKFATISEHADVRFSCSYGDAQSVSCLSFHRTVKVEESTILANTLGPRVARQFAEAFADTNDRAIREFWIHKNDGNFSYVPERQERDRLMELIQFTSVVIISSCPQSFGKSSTRRLLQFIRSMILALHEFDSDAGAGDLHSGSW